MAKRKAGKKGTATESYAYDDGSHFGSYALSKKVKTEDAETAPPAVAPASGGGPFPKHARPTEAECRAARDALASLHGIPIRLEPADSAEGKAKRTVLDSLVQTILSQNTTDTNSHRTFANLKAKFSTWELVRTANPSDIEAAIKMGGLAATKTARIQDILNSVHSEQGECSLEHLRQKSDEAIKAELLQYRGVGPKTVACVLMFCLGRFEFPVDTHVWRITKSLGWVPDKATREQTYEHLNLRIPDDVKYDLHVLLVEHGKRCARCAKKRPSKESHGPCPLVKLASAAEHSKAAIKAAVLELGAGDVPVATDAETAEDIKDEADGAVKTDPDEEQKVKIEAKPEIKVEPASPSPKQSKMPRRSSRK